MNTAVHKWNTAPMISHERLVPRHHIAKGKVVIQASVVQVSNAQSHGAC